MVKKISNLLLAIIVSSFFLFTSNVSAQTFPFDVTAYVPDTTIDINGYTEPNTLVTIENFGIVLGTTTSNSSGFYSRTFTPVDSGAYEITIYGTDSIGNDTEERTFSFTLAEKEEKNLHNITLPPTIYSNESTPEYNESFSVYVYGRPSQTMYLELQGGSSTTTISTMTSSAGQGVFTVNSSALTAGTYTAYAYFETLYRSAGISFEVQIQPTPTIAPTATTSPINPTSGSGPSATPDTETPTGTAEAPVTQIATQTPSQNTCPFPWERLCPFDGNTDTTIDLGGELETFIDGFIEAFGNTSEQFDINGNGVVDAEDLSLLMNYVEYTSGTIAFIHANPQDGDILTGISDAGGICGKKTLLNSQLTPALLITTLIGGVGLLMLTRIFAATSQSPSIFGPIGYGISTLMIVGSAFGLINSRTIQTQLVERRLVSKYQIGDTISYEAFLSNSNEPANSFDLYFSFDPNSMQVTTLDSAKSFFPIITKLEYSNSCGVIHIVGGLPKPVALFNRKPILKMDFKKIEGQNTALQLLPSSKAYIIQTDPRKELDYLTPNVNFVDISK